MSVTADNTAQKQQIGRPFGPGESGNLPADRKAQETSSVRLSCKPSLMTLMPMAKR